MKRFHKKPPSSRKRWSKNKESLKNIKRIDSDQNHGWQVHVRRCGKLKTKYFGDRARGGKIKALKLAKLHRDLLIEEMTKDALFRAVKRKPRTNTGHLGVSITHNVTKDGNKHKMITVTVRGEHSKVTTRKFSVRKHGYDQAVNKAVEWRKKVLRERLKAEKARIGGVVKV